MENAQTFAESLQDLWANIIGFIPEILGALLVLIVGLILASLLGKAVKKLFELSRIDKLLEKSGTKEELDKYGLKFNFAKVMGWLTKWFIIIATLIAVADILKLPQITQFLEEVVLYIPNILIGIAILVIGLIGGNLLRDIIIKAVSASNITDQYAGILGGLAKWSVVIFAFMAALVQLRIAPSLIQILFTGLVFMISLGGGLAIGLGGKDRAKEIIEGFGKRN